MRGLLLTGLFVFLWLSQVSAGLIWPTPNPAFQNGEPLEAYIQPTASGRIESGLFGCVRNDGYKFHEGVDLFPIERDRSGEALDPVFSVLPGRVVHVSAVSGHSSYGRYVVVSHEEQVPAFHTLYSHLATVAEGIVPGARVESGSVLGKMGRSAAGYTIPKSRAHLHFEIGFRLTDQFQAWYDAQKYSQPNRHSTWNGMNLVGIDPLEFYRRIQQGQVTDMLQHVQQLPAVARIRVFTSQVPSFVESYPALVTRAYKGQSLVAWDIAFTEFGLPKEWTPRFASEGVRGQAGDVQVIAYNPVKLGTQTCRRVLNSASPNSKPTISKGTIVTLQKLFGFK
ncbi:MAG: peptidoglycan DD-metalloendopeptidase family protein [Coraliomargarita sp.]